MKTDKDVEKFINSLDGSFKGKIIVKSTDEVLKRLYCKLDTQNLGIKNWDKSDFNNDGLSDLLVIGFFEDLEIIYVAIDQGNNNFKLIPIKGDLFSGCNIVESIKVNNQFFLLHHTNMDNTFGSKKTFETDTLTYKFYGFIELNTEPLTIGIQSIKVETTRCFGTCPVFSIVINQKGKAIYTAGQFSKKIGVFETYVESEKLKEIYDVIHYINPLKLKDKYNLDVTDLPSVTLEITFTNGTTKKIIDYGESGTFGLSKVYALMFALRDNQNWTKATPFSFNH